MPLIIRFLATVITAFLFCQIAISMYDLKPKKIRVILSSVIIGIAFFAVVMLINAFKLYAVTGVSLTLINIALVALVFKAFFNLNIFKGLFASALSYIPNFIVEALYMLILAAIKTKHNTIFNDITLMLIVNGVMLLLMYLLLLLIRYVKKRWQFIHDALQKPAGAYTFYIIINILVLAINVSVVSGLLNKGADLKQVITLAVVFLSYFAITFITGKGLFNLQLKSQELTQQRFYNRATNGLLDDIRAYKHNFDNILASINGYANQQSWSDLNLYLNELSQRQGAVALNDTIIYSKIKNAGLAGLFQAKINAMQERGIALKLIVAQEVNEVNCKISDLCEMLGIMLDNAMEAAAETEEKGVKITINKEDDAINFIIDNSTNNEPDIVKIQEKGWSSKGENRGLGLWILNSIVNKYKNIVFNIYADNKQVRQEIIIKG